MQEKNRDMKPGRKVLGVLAVCATGIVLPRTAAADEWDKRTILTFNQPVEIPGKVLPGYDGPSGRVGRYAHHVRRAAGWRPISDQEVVLSR